MTAPDEARPGPEDDGSHTARAHLCVCEQADGACLVYPVVSPDLASYGSEADAIAEQALFLRELVPRAAPGEISRLSLPDGARLVTVGVVVPREDLPRRLQSDVPVDFACVVVPASPASSGPASGDRWVMVPSLRHTFYVEEDEDLDEAVRSEVRRIIVAEDLTPWEVAGLFPARAHRLQALPFPLDGHERGEAGVPLRKAIAAKARREQAVAALLAVSTPLHVTIEGQPPLVGRDDELGQLRAILDGKERLGVLLVGPEHAGKSALVRAYVRGDKRLVYSTSGAQLIAGMSGLGQWQERIRDVMEAAHTLDAVIYLESLEDLVAERTESGGADLAGAMRPYLDDGRVRVLAEIRAERLDALEGQKASFLSHFSRIKVEPLSPKGSLEVLQKRAAHDARAEPSRPRVDPAALPALVDLAERYLPYGAFPGKAVRLYQDLRAAHEQSPGSGDAPVLGKPALYAFFSLSTGIPEILLRDDAPLRVEDVAAALRKHIIGQERAIQALSETIGVIKAGLQPSGKPLATFLFVGPTGVGKTELARALAETLFRSPDRMVRFDMSEFMTPDAAERLIRGTERADGLLTRRVREQPFCVLLLDEIEKAHPAVFDLLLQVAGEGRLTDAAGRTAYFHNAILIMTSNLGAAERRNPAGFTAGASTDEAHYQKLVNASFRPEFVNRLDRVVPFRSLSREEVQQVARLAVDRVKKRRGLGEAGVALELSEAALARFGEDGYSEAYGARALRRHLDEHLAGPVARLLSGLGGEAQEQTLDVTLASEAEVKREGLLVQTREDGPFRLDLRRRKSAKAAQQAYGEAEIGRLRREIDRFLLLAPVVQVKEQLELLVAELSRSDGPKKIDRRFAQENAELSADHHRLSGLWERISKAQEDLYSVEEIAILALFEGQEVLPFVADARAAHRAFRRALPYVMLAMEPHRDEIVMIVEELDEGVFDVVLRPLLLEIPRRGWSVICHVEGGEKLADEAWPDDRRWGPPRQSAWLIEALSAPKRGFRSVLLRVKGPYAGALLALEAGLHRVEMPKREAKGEKGEKGDDGRGHVLLRTVAFKIDLPADAWAHRALVPPQASTAGLRRRGAVARERKAEGAVLVAGRRARVEIDLDEYWQRVEEVALAHLLLFELDEGALDRDEIFAPAVEVE
jgi:ATP-dependent Clp protease ATP-binding subunit ClpC